MKVKSTAVTSAYWRVTFDNAPINLFDQQMIDELAALMTKLENDSEVKVVVFDSAIPDYFMAHLDVAKAHELKLEPGPTGLSPWPDIALRLEQAPFISIGLVRGRARAVGSEFLQALDLRFGSKEKAVLSQVEVGLGIIPGGGALERLPLLVGRSRAIEIICGSQDFDADTAALYGWINRSLPDHELDAFVDTYVQRISRFDRQAIAAAKGLINKRAVRPDINSFSETQKAFFIALGWKEYQQRAEALFPKGFGQDSELEKNLGTALGG